MKKGERTIITFWLILASLFIPEEIASQEVSVNADIVSTYLFRGVHQGTKGPAVQPALSITKGDFSLGAWGSTDFHNSKELDLSLCYNKNGWGITISDYWYPGEGSGSYFKWKESETPHLLEGTVSYCFGEKLPLSLSWSTIFYGNDKDANGDNYYSSYFEAGYSLSVKEVAVDLGVGISPFKSDFYVCKKFNVVNIFIKGTKELKITNSFTLPIFAQAIFNPEAEEAHLVLGISF